MWRIRGPEESTLHPGPARLEIDLWGGNARPPSTQGTHQLKYFKIKTIFKTLSFRLMSPEGLLL